MNKNILRIATSMVFGVGLFVVALLVMGAPAKANAASLYRELELGMSGADVGSLQTFLAQDRTIYPQGLVTNYFGSLTKSAVSNFQARNGIASVGRVGPATLPVINAQMEAGMNTSVNAAPIIYGINVNSTNDSATVAWSTNELARGEVYYSNNPLLLTEYLNSVTVTNASVASIDATARTSQSVNISGLQSETTYYYMIYVTDQSGNVSVSWPTTFRTR